MDVFWGLDQMNLPPATAIELAHGALDLGMACVADEHHVQPIPGVTGHLDMDFGDQRTGGIENGEPACLRVAANLLRHAMSGENAGCPRRDFVDLINENRPSLTQPVHDKPVVNHLVADINRCAELV